MTYIVSFLRRIYSVSCAYYTRTISKLTIPHSTLTFHLAENPFFSEKTRLCFFILKIVSLTFPLGGNSSLATVNGNFQVQKQKFRDKKSGIFQRTTFSLSLSKLLHLHFLRHVTIFSGFFGRHSSQVSQHDAC